jgi:hypothetical protein
MFFFYGTECKVPKRERGIIVRQRYHKRERKMSEIPRVIHQIPRVIHQIPRVIHQIWFQGSPNLPEKYRKFQQTWKETTGFKYEFWDAERIESLLVYDNKWKETYHSFPTMIQKIDFAKYLILFVHGGIYVDMDAFAFPDTNVRLEDLLTAKKNVDFLVFQHNTPSGTVTFNKCMGLVGMKIINNAVIFSTRNNKKMKLIILSCMQAQKRWKRKCLSLQLRCLVTTGPIVFTNCVRSIPGWKECMMPYKMFEPYTTFEMENMFPLYKKWKKLQENQVNQDNQEKDELNEWEKLILFLSTQRDMEGTIAVHVLDLSWFKNGKDNWKFKTFRSLVSHFCKSDIKTESVGRVLG